MRERDDVICRVKSSKKDVRVKRETLIRKQRCGEREWLRKGGIDREKKRESRYNQLRNAGIAQKVRRILECFVGKFPRLIELLDNKSIQK